VNRNRNTTALVASPVLVGAVTALVVCVGVFLAYNANAGLPFVPTYTLRAELPTGAKLVKGNEVRVGGFRVGAVSRIDGAVRKPGGRRRAVAVVQMELDKSIEPLSADTRLRVRPRSALGVKYIEITPGRSKRTLAAGDTVPLAQGSQSKDFEDAFATFDRDTRPNLRQATEGLGTAFTGRGQSVNQALAALPPLLDHLEPVMVTLSDPSTDLRGLVRNLGAVAGQVAPVAPQAAALARNGADTFAALNRSPEALADAIAATPPTLAVGTRALRRSRPVVEQATVLVRKLRPATRELPATLPPVSDALRIGTPVLGRSVALSDRLRGSSVALRNLIRDPATGRSLGSLRNAVAQLKPTVSFVAPYQTVCNFASYFFHALGEHQSQPAPGGNAQQQLLRFVNQTQPNTLGFTYSSRPWDLQPGQPAHGATFDGQPAGRPIAPPYQPAIDSQGNADCQNGQVGFPNFRLIEDFVRKNGAAGNGDPTDIVTGTLPDGTAAGANSVVGKSDYPGLAGGTYKSRELGIDNLKDVP
jgi:virulence factor Mce-like protein